MSSPVTPAEVVLLAPFAKAVTNPPLPPVSVVEALEALAITLATFSSYLLARALPNSFA